MFPERCAVCGLYGSWLCPKHQGLPPAPPNQVTYQFVDKVFVVTAYSDPKVQKLIEAFKFQGLKSIAQGMGVHMATKLKDKPVVLCPIPLHWRRWWWRGYNQADYLARAICVVDPEHQKLSLLKRIKPTQQQARLSKPDRAQNMRAAFEYIGQTIPEMVYLVDDVVASGATLEAAAQALKAAGVQRVEAVVFARGGK